MEISIGIKHLGVLNDLRMLGRSEVHKEERSHKVFPEFLYFPDDTYWDSNTQLILGSNPNQTDEITLTILSVPTAIINYGGNHFG